jgi:UDP-3-O-[3-hydroxymyristoyl] glucosamine N-acyltransferase
MVKSSFTITLRLVRIVMLQRVFRIATIIGESTKLDAFVHYAHGVQCGKECLIVAHAMIGGMLI